MKGFDKRISISEMVPLGERREKTNGVKVLLARGCKEDVLLIKEVC